MTKLTKSYTDKKIFGVCGGLAKYFNVDATLIRIGFAAALIVGFGSPLLIYVLMGLLMPDEEYF
ncbi:PspC domain-containing protein [Sediminitomix flava]|uniref:Phage shock protein C (PspC) family protein n=1 Tax=Sediminitomix flava TaxID=379075 RepID=A0A315ZFX0_SEDFL|nr:PspC domain-containing protein [Sediminitomix flava]PWJ44049.1 phage shock protein C (PspC) family protein [Sediminitomix flava]